MGGVELNMAWEGPDEVVLAGFTWDERKDIANREKHGVDFEEAVTCFAPGRDKSFMRSTLKGEARWILHGTSDWGRPLSLIFCLEVTGGEAVARIISARRR